MTNGFRNPRIAPNWWMLPKPANGVVNKKDPLVHGQMLLVGCNEGFDYIPCFPKPGAEKTSTRVTNGSWIVYLGRVEFNGATCMEFMNNDTQEIFYLGDGALPYLINIPKHRVNKGHPFRKKRGSKVGKNGIRRTKGRRKRIGVELKKLPVPILEPEKKEE